MNIVSNLIFHLIIAMQIAQQPHKVVVLVYLMQNLHLKGHTPPIIFAWIVRPMNALQLCCWHFSRKETVADFLQAMCHFTWKTAVLRFWAPPPPWSS